LKAVDIRPGLALNLDGRLMVVVKYEHRTPGNLRAFCQVKLKDVQTGQHLEKRLNPGDEVPATTLDRRQMEYLYKDGDGYVFMDNTTFDQMTLNEEMAGEAMQYMRPNSSATVLIHEERPVLIELPAAVDLTVAECEPGMKGATVTNVGKEATLETGLKTRVPDFIAAGELIRVSTSDGSYISRSKE
jgi:elongation factor P